MAEYQRSNIRVSDTEREDALGKLGQHMTEGRLDLDEYGERTAKVTAAKTRGDVLALFEDLPEPRPAFGRPRPPAPREASPSPTFAQFAMVLLPALLILVAVGLTYTLKWPVFLLPLVFFFVVNSRRHGHGSRGHRRGR